MSKSIARPSTREFLEFARKSKLLNLNLSLEEAMEHAATLEANSRNVNPKDDDDDDDNGWFIVSPSWFLITGLTQRKESVRNVG